MTEPYARMRMLTTQGPHEVVVHDPADASRIAEHWNAVRTFLQTGDVKPLAGFEGEEIDGEFAEADVEAAARAARARAGAQPGSDAGADTPPRPIFETDPDAIEAWDRAGTLDFEEIYRG